MDDAGRPLQLAGGVPIPKGSPAATDAGPWAPVVFPPGVVRTVRRRRLLHVVPAAVVTCAAALPSRVSRAAPARGVAVDPGRRRAAGQGQQRPAAADFLAVHQHHRPGHGVHPGQGRRSGRPEGRHHVGLRPASDERCDQRDPGLRGALRLRCRHPDSAPVVARRKDHRRAIRPFDGFSRTGAHCIGAAATALSATPTKKTTPRRLHRQHRTESRRRH